MKKTTIAISTENREKLQKIKQFLEKKKNHFVDMDEAFSEVINSYDIS
jgi:predicted CopG family antitoxin